MNNKEFLHKLLTSNDVVEAIRNNIDDLLSVMPELSPMIGFEHNNPGHIFDVWEHTLHALGYAPNDFDVRLTLLLHDSGKPHSYQEDNGVRRFWGHPEVSAQIAKSILIRLGYPNKYIDYICKLITHHDTPLSKDEILAEQQFAQTLFEVQKCDAWSHNPQKNQNRLEYIKATTKIFDKQKKE